MCVYKDVLQHDEKRIETVKSEFLHIIHTEINHIKYVNIILEYKNDIINFQRQIASFHIFSAYVQSILLGFINFEPCNLGSAPCSDAEKTSLGIVPGHGVMIRL